MQDKNVQSLVSNSRAETTAGKKAPFVVPDGVHVIWLYGAGGGDGGFSGATSPGSQYPGHGGSGGNGCAAYYWNPNGSGQRADLLVNPGDVLEIEVGEGGLSDRPGSHTVVKQMVPGSAAPQKTFTFGDIGLFITRGGSGGGSGRDRSGDGTSKNGVPGGRGLISYRGNQDNHWGGGGGGGGAGFNGAGGNGGQGGADGGSEIGMGGTGSDAFKAAHRGKPGQAAGGCGAGGGGGGGGGDTDKDGNAGIGAPGGKGGDGYLEILW